MQAEPGLHETGRDGDRLRYAAGEGGPGTRVDVRDAERAAGAGRRRQRASLRLARPGRGHQQQWRAELVERGAPVTGSSGHAPLVLLHGTGGDKHDLMGLPEHLDPQAVVLSVSENGMLRSCRRLREGVFDEDDLRTRTTELAEFLTAAEHAYGHPRQCDRGGFSNGANIASAPLFQHPRTLAGAALLAAMVPFRDGPPAAELTGKRVALARRRRNPLATLAHTDTLDGQLRTAGAEVTGHGHDGGHQIEPHTAAFLQHEANHGL